MTKQRKIKGFVLVDFVVPQIGAPKGEHILGVYQSEYKAQEHFNQLNRLVGMYPCEITYTLTQKKK